MSRPKDNSVRVECSCGKAPQHIPVYISSKAIKPGEKTVASPITDFITRAHKDLGAWSENWFEELKTVTQVNVNHEETVSTSENLSPKKTKFKECGDFVASSDKEKQMDIADSSSKMNGPVNSVSRRNCSLSPIVSQSSYNSEIKQFLKKDADDGINGNESMTPIFPISKNWGLGDVKMQGFKMHPNSSPVLTWSPILTMKERGSVQLPIFETPEQRGSHCSTPICVASLRGSLGSDTSDIRWSPSMETPSQQANLPTFKEDTSKREQHKDLSGYIRTPVLSAHPRTLFHSWNSEDMAAVVSGDANSTQGRTNIGLVAPAISAESLNDALITVSNEQSKVCGCEPLCFTNDERGEDKVAFMFDVTLNQRPVTDSKMRNTGNVMPLCTEASSGGILRSDSNLDHALAIPFPSEDDNQRVRVVDDEGVNLQEDGNLLDIDKSVVTGPTLGKMKENEINSSMQCLSDSLSLSTIEMLYQMPVPDTQMVLEMHDGKQIVEEPSESEKKRNIDAQPLNIVAQKTNAPTEAADSTSAGKTESVFVAKMAMSETDVEESNALLRNKENNTFDLKKLCYPSSTQISKDNLMLPHSVRIGMELHESANLVGLEENNAAIVDGECDNIYEQSQKAQIPANCLGIDLGSNDQLSDEAEATLELCEQIIRSDLSPLELSQTQPNSVMGQNDSKKDIATKNLVTVPEVVANETERNSDQKRGEPSIYQSKTTESSMSFHLGNDNSKTSKNVILKLQDVNGEEARALSLDEALLQIPDKIDNEISVSDDRPVAHSLLQDLTDHNPETIHSGSSRAAPGKEESMDEQFLAADEGPVFTNDLIDAIGEANAAAAAVYSVKETKVSLGSASHNKVSFQPHFNSKSNIGGQRMSGFATASGKAVDINENSLKAARDLFSKDFDEPLKPISDPFLASVNENDCEINVDGMSNSNKRIVGSELTVFATGFKTAAGRAVKVDEKSLQAAKVMLDSELSNVCDKPQNSILLPRSDCEKNKTPDSSSKSTLSDLHLKDAFSHRITHTRLITKSVKKWKQESCGIVNKLECSGQKKYSSLFSTASGRKVNVSANALERVKDIFDNDEVGSNVTSMRTMGKMSYGDKGTTSDLQTEPRRINCNKAVHQESRDLLHREEKENTSAMLFHDDRKGQPHGQQECSKRRLMTGFATASGNEVDINENLLKEVTDMLNMCDSNDNIPGNSDELQSSTAEPKANALCASNDLHTPAVSPRKKAMRKTLKNAKRLFSETELGFAGEMKRTCTRDLGGSSDAEETVLTVPPDLKKEQENSALRTVCHFVEDPKEVPFYRQEDDNDEKSASEEMQPIAMQKETYKTNALCSQEITGSNPSLTGKLDFSDPQVRKIAKRVMEFLVEKFRSLDKACSVSDFMPLDVDSLLEEMQSKEHFGSTSRDEKKMKHVDYEFVQCNKTRVFDEALLRNICNARKEQDERIKEKMQYKNAGDIKPGKLFILRSSGAKRIRLRDAVMPSKRPSWCNAVANSQATKVQKSTRSINACSATSFRFDLLEYLIGTDKSKISACFKIGDEALLIPAEDYTAGKEEFCRAFFDSPGVVPSLISEKWVYNHYRWIVWKLAAMEISFPHIFWGRCLTPDEVMYQLKYRYDKEVDKCQRSAIKKIMERDEVSIKTMILCVAGIVAKTNDVRGRTGDECTRLKDKATESHPKSVLLELTDGWYSIFASMDPALQRLVNHGKITVGQKLIISCAELTGPDTGFPPLEAPPDLMLRISANSTRRARWDAKLGFFHRAMPFPVLLPSLFLDGGFVGCIECLIVRAYPVLYLEKYQDGGSVIRNQKVESIVAKKHMDLVEMQIEKLACRLRKDLEENENHNEKVKKRHSNELTHKKIENLVTGEELLNALRESPDPAKFMEELRESQKTILNNCQEQEMYRQQSNFNEELQKMIAEEEMEKRFPRARDVTPFLKLRIIDLKSAQNCDNSNIQSWLLTVWRPSEDLCCMLKEGKAYAVYHIIPSLPRGRNVDLNLNTTSHTSYLEKNLDDSVFLKQFERQVTKLDAFVDPSFRPLFREVDVVGLVFLIKDAMLQENLAQTVYLTDSELHILAIKFVKGLQSLGAENIFTIGQFISAANIHISAANIQGDYVGRIPCAHASDISVFSLHPKSKYLQKAMEEMKAKIKDVGVQVGAAKRRVSEWFSRKHQSVPEALTHASSPATRRKVPVNNSYNMASSVNEITPKVKVLHAKSLTVPRRRYPTYSPYMPSSSKNSSRSGQQGQELNSVTKLHDNSSECKKALQHPNSHKPLHEWDYLSPTVQSRLEKLQQYGEPPDLPCLYSPSVDTVHKGYTIARRNSAKAKNAQ